MKNLECKVLEIWGDNKAPHGQEEKYKELKNDFMLRFTEMVNATTENDFDNLYARIKTNYTNILYILAYIKDTMMLLKGDWTEYICQYMPSFSQRTTSRLKSSHEKLKHALVNRTGYPYDILKDIHQVIQRDCNTHKVLVDAAENRVTTRHNVKAFQHLHTAITLPGLELLCKQYDLAKVQLSKADRPGYVPRSARGHSLTCPACIYYLVWCRRMAILHCNPPKLDNTGISIHCAWPTIIPGMTILWKISQQPRLRVDLRVLM
jgi:hypothetical protein